MPEGYIATTDTSTTLNIKTKAGNTLQVFYNPENDLLIVDLVAANGSGGNEIVRKTLNEKKLLRHCAPSTPKGKGK